MLKYALTIFMIITPLWGDSNAVHKVMKSIMMGVAIGDAFGTGIEGRDRYWIHDHVDFTKYVSIRSLPYQKGYTLGDYSDDTSDTLAMMQALINATEGKPYTREHLIEQIHIQYDQSRITRNGDPRSGFGSISWVFEGKKSLDEVRNFQIARDYPGNAPVMRSIPLAFVKEELIEPYGIINADTTHPHPKSRAASIIIARAARYMLIERGLPAGLIEYCRRHIQHLDQETYDYLGKVDLLNAHVDEIEPRIISKDFIFLVGPQPIKSFMDFSPIVGLNSDSMRTAGTALYLLKHCTSTFEALKRSMLIGGDVDSLAAVVVGIMAGKHGTDDLPQFMFDGLENCEGLKVFSHRFADAVWSREEGVRVEE